jgi:hypothetical protein
MYQITLHNPLSLKPEPEAKRRIFNFVSLDTSMGPVLHPGSCGERTVRAQFASFPQAAFENWVILSEGISRPETKEEKTMNVKARNVKANIGGAERKMPKELHHKLNEFMRITGLTQEGVAAHADTTRNFVASCCIGRRQLSLHNLLTLEKKTGVDHRTFLSPGPLKVCPALGEVLRMVDPAREDWNYRKEDLEFLITPRQSLIDNFGMTLYLRSLHVAKVLLAAILSAPDSTLNRLWEVDRALRTAIEHVSERCNLGWELELLGDYPLITDWNVGLGRWLCDGVEIALLGSTRKNATNPLANLLFYALENESVLHAWIERSAER